MRIALAADHAGFELKEALAKDIRLWGHEVEDVGTHEPGKPDDYPDFAELVADRLMKGKADRGILVCGSGAGVSVAINKFPGMRGSVCHDTYSAHQGVEHDDMNVLCLGSRIVGIELAREIVRTFLAARFSGEPRHARRLEKVLAIERRFLR